MSGSTHVGLLVVAVVLVVLAGVFAAGESALSRLSRTRADELVRDGRRHAGTLQAVLADPGRYVNLLTFLRVVAEVVATVLVTLVCLDVLPRLRALALASVVMVVVSYVAIGVSPRTVGRQHADRVGLLTAGVVHPLARVLGPIPALLILVGNALTPGRALPDGPFATEAELRDLVDLAQENRLIEADERAMIHSVF
ncbi:MAG TPA: DUF21 domain-containing protein, partial [Actinomycetes bacterium]|nr:DUF21 domain-containing protein [Actinomycetes bacterium]